MADKKTFTIEINGIEKAYNEAISLKDALDKLAGSQVNLNSTINQQQEQNKAASTSIEGLKKKIEELSSEYESMTFSQRKIFGDELLDKIQKYELLLSSSTDAQRKQNEATQDTIALNDTQIGSIEQMTLKLELLKKQYEKLSDLERKSSKGSQLALEIQILTNELSDLSRLTDSHLSALGAIGESIQLISDGFENSGNAISSFSGILSSGSEVLELFGVESRTIAGVVDNLGKVTSTLNTLQAFHTQLVGKDSIVMKTATLVKLLYTKATNSSSIALKGFKTAMISTGIGAFIVLIGALIANFDEVKKVIGNAVGGMEKLDSAMDSIGPVISGVGNALVQYLLIPVKQVMNVISGAISVFKIIKEKGLDSFDDVVAQMKKTGKNAVDIQIKGLNVLKNYQEAYNNKVLSDEEKKAKILLKKRADLLKSQIADLEAQQGAEWKYTEQGIQTYRDYYDTCLKLYQQDSEEYKNIQREKWGFERELLEKNKPKAISKPKKDPNDYLKDIKNIEKQTDELFKQTDEKLIEHLKGIAEEYSNPDALNAIKHANSLELNLLKKKQDQEKEDIAEHQKELEEKYKKDKAKVLEIKEAFALQIKALDKKQDKETLDLQIQQAEKLKEIEDKIKNKQLQDESKNFEDRIINQQKFIDSQKKIAEDANKDLVKRNGIGLIDINATKENYQKAIDEDKKYLTQLQENNIQRQFLRSQELALYATNSEETKAIRDKMAKEEGEYAKNVEQINKRIKENRTKEGETSLSFFKDLQGKMADAWGKISQGMGDAVKMMTSVLDEQINDIKSKVAETTKQYDAVVAKKKESDDKIKSLEEEAKNASGGRSIVLQEQIARQMDANAELAKQEKELAKQKEKLEKEQAKKEKQKKKIELTQNLITGIANVALGVTKALATGPIVGKILAALTAAAGAVQTGIIAKQLSKLENGGLLQGKSHKNGGMRIEGTNIEVEGDEYVVNRISTRKNLGLISYINKNRKELTPQDVNNYFQRSGSGNHTERAFSSRKMYEDGGQLTNLEVMDSMNASDSNKKILDAIAQINFRPVVSVVDIASAQNNVTEVKDIAGV